MEKKKYKSGSLKCKEKQEAEQKESAKRCRPITDFVISSLESIPIGSSSTKNEEVRNNTVSDDLLTCRSQGQDKIETTTKANFTNELNPITFSALNAPSYIIPVVTSSKIDASFSNRKSNFSSDIIEFVSEAPPVNSPRHNNNLSTIEQFQRPTHANLKQFFAAHPLQPLNDLPFDARL